MLADREGRLEDRPLRIKAAILPYDDANIDLLLEELEKVNMIIRYEHRNVRYIQVVNFLKHQNPHIKEQPSTIPVPCKHGASTVQEPDLHGSCPADSLLLIPDSKPSCASSDARVSNFEIFWKAYPKKKNKGDAEKAWKAIRPDAGLTKRMLEAVEVAKAGDDWRKERGQFIPYPASWLRAKGWEDVPETHNIETAKPKPVCRVCGLSASYSLDGEWYCGKHGKYDK